MSCRHDLANTTCARCWPDRGGLDSNGLPQVDPGPGPHEPNLDGPGAAPPRDDERLTISRECAAMGHTQEIGRFCPECNPHVTLMARLEIAQARAATERAAHERTKLRLHDSLQQTEVAEKRAETVERQRDVSRAEESRLSTERDATLAKAASLRAVLVYCRDLFLWEKQHKGNDYVLALQAITVVLGNPAPETGSTFGDVLKITQEMEHGDKRRG